MRDIKLLEETITMMIDCKEIMEQDRYQEKYNTYFKKNDVVHLMFLLEDDRSKDFKLLRINSKLILKKCKYYQQLRVNAYRS